MWEEYNSKKKLLRKTFVI